MLRQPVASLLQRRLLSAYQQHQPQPQQQLLAAAAAAAALPHTALHLQQQQRHSLPAAPTCSCSYASSSTASASAAAAADAAASTSNKRAVKYPTKQKQRVAHLKFCQQRAAWRLQVKELRKQWLEEARQQKAAHRAAAESVKQQIAQLQQLRDANKQHDKEQHLLDNMLRSAERAVETAERRLQAAQRQEWRQETLQRFRKRWRRHLEGESSSWIAPEDLEARIAAALDYPRKL